jgi:hypothetical protein
MKQMREIVLTVSFPIFFLFILFIRPASGLLDSNGEEDKKAEALAVESSLSLKLSGFAQLQFAENNDSNDSFSIRRARLSLGGNLLRKLHFKLQADLTKSPVLLDALAEVTFRKELNLGAGQFLVPFSLENTTSAGELLTINRSQTVEKMAPGRDNGAIGRDIGAFLFGSYSFFDYAIGLVNGSGINKTDDNNHKDLVGRFLIRPFKATMVGFSFYSGRQRQAGEAIDLLRDKYGMELMVNYSRFKLVAEFIQAKDDRVKRQGWYVQNSLYLIPEKYQLVFRIDSINLDKSLPGQKTIIYTAGANWFLSSKSKLQANFEYHRKETGSDHRAILLQLQAGF